ncbi:MAPEG family protein [Acidovorax sp.]|uniref:MAPEG family protein n=1 Tax=Acidovorax sp. TaxID=1872122 RepID=UPI0039E34629
MSQTSILLPAMALAGWTLCVLLLLPYHRFKAVRAGHVNAHDFKHGESPRVPPSVSIPNRNLMNLLEIPVLFYFVSIVIFVSQLTDSVAVGLAWSYVILRVLHSLIHLTYNDVIHRLVAFAASNAVLVVLWLRVGIALVSDNSAAGA